MGMSTAAMKTALVAGALLLILHSTDAVNCRIDTTMINGGVGSQLTHLSAGTVQCAAACTACNAGTAAIAATNNVALTAAGHLQVITNAGIVTLGNAVCPSVAWQLAATSASPAISVVTQGVSPNVGTIATIGPLTAAGAWAEGAAGTDAAPIYSFCPCPDLEAQTCPLCTCADIGAPTMAPTNAPTWPTTAPTVLATVENESYNISDDAPTAGDIAGIVIGAVGGSFLLLLIGVLVGGMVGGKSATAAAPAGQL